MKISCDFNCNDDRIFVLCLQWLNWIKTFSFYEMPTIKFLIKKISCILQIWESIPLIIVQCLFIDACIVIYFHFLKIFRHLFQLCSVVFYLHGFLCYKIYLYWFCNFEKSYGQFKTKEPMWVKEPCFVFLFIAVHL